MPPIRVGVGLILPGTRTVRGGAFWDDVRNFFSRVRDVGSKVLSAVVPTIGKVASQLLPHALKSIGKLTEKGISQLTGGPKIDFGKEIETEGRRFVQKKLAPAGLKTLGKFGKTAQKEILGEFGPKGSGIKLPLCWRGENIKVSPNITQTDLNTLLLKNMKLNGKGLLEL